MRLMKKLIALLLLILATYSVLAQDEEKTIPYFQSSAFNVPRLGGWEDQSTDTVAQFYYGPANATIRTAMASEEDILTAVRRDLRDLVGTAPGDPIYDGKVNLADGTWRSLIFEPDDVTTISVMARKAGSQTAIISFIERDPAARTVLLTLAQADDSLEDASPEIARAAKIIAGIDMNYLAPVEITALLSGEWIIYEGDGFTAMGMVFGNDSYVALQEGAPGDLAALVEAYNRTLLGFFITPDNSGYLALALAAVFVILGGLLLSFYWRWRNLRQDLAMIARLQQA